MSDILPSNLSFQRKYAFYTPLLKACNHDSSDLNKTKEQIAAWLKLRQEVVTAHLNLRDNCKDLQYKQSCRPFLFNIKEPRYTCCLPTFCPWCFVRKRVLPATTVIRQHVVQHKLETKYMLSSCFHLNTDYPVTNKAATKDQPAIKKGVLTLHKAFERRSMLHTKLDSIVSKVFCVPYFHVVDKTTYIGTLSCGFFLHPKSIKLEEVLPTKPSFANVQVGTCTEDLSQAAVYDCFGTTLANINWQHLYDANNPQYLALLLDIRHSKQKYLRNYNGKLNGAIIVQPTDTQTDSSKEVPI